MSDRDNIHAYLKSLSRYLSRLDKTEADEVIREIESHIYDALEAQDPTRDVQSIIDGFGPPRELAAGYVEHILKGAPPPAGFRAILIVKTGATRGLYFSTAFLGYLFSGAFLLLGLLKPFAPDQIGFWVAEHGQSFALGAIEQAPEGTFSILGWWFMPFAIGIGAAGIYLTRRLLRVLKAQL